MIGQLKQPNWVNHLAVPGTEQVIDVVYEADSNCNLLLQRKKANKFFWETQEGLNKLVLNDRITILHYWVVSPKKSLLHMEGKKKKTTKVSLPKYIPSSVFPKETNSLHMLGLRELITSFALKMAAD